MVLVLDMVEEVTGVDMEEEEEVDMVVGEGDMEDTEVEVMVEVMGVEVMVQGEVMEVVLEEELQLLSRDQLVPVTLGGMIKDKIKHL